MVPSEQRRAHVRYNLTLSGTYAVQSLEREPRTTAQGSAEIRDVSLVGMKIELHDLPPAVLRELELDRQRLSLVVKHPHSDKTMTVAGRLMWAHVANARVTRVGIRFHTLDETILKTLLSWSAPRASVQFRPYPTAIVALVALLCLSLYLWRTDAGDLAVVSAQNTTLQGHIRSCQTHLESTRIESSRSLEQCRQRIEACQLTRPDCGIAQTDAGADAEDKGKTAAPSPSSRVTGADASAHKADASTPAARAGGLFAD